jgi:hypothetical protein
VHPENAERQTRALNLALYKLAQLSTQMHKSRRALNDLRTIRRLLFTAREAELNISRSPAGRPGADEAVRPTLLGGHRFLARGLIAAGDVGDDRARGDP